MTEAYASDIDLSYSFFFLIDRKGTVTLFEISARDVITTDYTIIMSRTLKVTGYHVMYDRRARFLRVIVSTSRDSCCLPSVKKQKHNRLPSFFVQFIIKQLLDSVFVISRIMKVSARVKGFG